MSDCALPQELLDKIIDALFDDLAALAACSLAGKPFVRARSYFFHTITLGPELFQKFHTLLAVFPHVKPWVRKLVIIGSTAAASGSSVQFGNRRISSYSDRFLPLVLDALADSSSNLKSFVFNAGDLNRLFWGFMSVQLQSSILQILQVHSLRHISFYRFSNFPPSVFTHFKNLESLEMVESASLASHFSLQTPGSSNRSHLQSLTITDDFAFSLGEANPLLSWLYGPYSSFDLSNLQECHLEFPSDGEMRLQSHPNLSRITIRLLFNVTYDVESGSTLFNRQPFQQIAAQLVSAPLLSLKTLEIIMEIAVDDHHHLPPGTEWSLISKFTPIGSPISHWDALDASLALLPSLRQVQFILILHDSTRSFDFYTVDELNRALHFCLPGASAKQTLLDLRWQSSQH